MATAPRMSNSDRLRALRNLLTRLRDETYGKIVEFRRDQSQENLSTPGDEMDVARSSTDVETHASLIERAEDRLRLIDEALARVSSGNYGVCAECGDDIPIERLKALPFAVFCVDCQEKRTRSRGRWSTVEPYSERWTPPAEAEDQDNVRVADINRNEDNLTIHDDDSFGAEEEMGAEPEAPKRRRGRPRKVAAERR